MAASGYGRTLRAEVGFADGFPFLLIAQSSLDDLSARLARSLPMNRFRPNVVVQGCAPYADVTWRRLRIGAIPCVVAKPCARCVITTTDQDTAERGAEPLATLATYRRVGSAVMFGQNLVHEAQGVLPIGDLVRIE